MPRAPQPFRIDLRDFMPRAEVLDAIGAESHIRQCETAIVRTLKKDAVAAYEERLIYRPSVRTDGGSRSVLALIEAGLLVPDGDPLVWVSSTKDRPIGAWRADRTVEIVGHWRLTGGLGGQIVVEVA